MDGFRVAAYLRSACAVLDFDIGELWCARNSQGQKPVLKFIQLYTSPTYEDFHSLLIRPENASGDSPSLDEEKHRMSPIMCRCVCDGGQIVWANTLNTDGLTGRTDLPLNTAVGLPICSIGSDLYILVLFAIEAIQITPNAVEFLNTLARAASEGVAGFLPASIIKPVSSPNAEVFIGVWDMMELIKKYAGDISFHAFPLGMLESFYDYQELLAFKEIFQDFKSIRDDSLSQKLLDSLRDSTLIIDDTPGTSSGAQSLIPYNSAGPGGFTVEMDETSTQSSTSESGRDKKSRSRRHTASNTALNSTMPITDSSVAFSEPIRTTEVMAYNRKLFPVDAKASYKKNRNRFHEFMVAIIGMTVFDAAELWMQSERSRELYVVAALHGDGIMQVWTSQSRDVRLKLGQDVPGVVVKTNQPYWDRLYDSHADNLESYPRALHAESIGIKTAFAVPLPGPNGACGALALYSRSAVDVEPLIITFILKAAQLMSAGALDASILGVMDIESLVYSPKALLCDWTNKKQKLLSQGLAAETTNPIQPITEYAYDAPQMKIHMMGSLSPGSYLNNKLLDRRLPVAPERHVSFMDCESREYVEDDRSGTLPPSLADHHDTNCTRTSISHPADSTTDGGDSEHLRKSAWAQPVAQDDNASSREFDGDDESGDDGSSDIGHIPPQTSTSPPLHDDDVTTLMCRFEGCNNATSNRQSIFCAAHTGTRRCQHEGCSKCAQGATKFCIAHGGGRRCTFPGCMKGARDKRFCAAHGGGKRCSFVDCQKSAVGGSSFCTGHGGGKRCQYEGCSKSSQANTSYCVKHGGGRKCIIESCEKVARGKTDYCASHGGGMRCIAPNCNRTAAGKLNLCKVHCALAVASGGPDSTDGGISILGKRNHGPH